MNRSALETHFSCGDYFKSAWAVSGLYDHSSQLMFILPASDIELVEAEQFLGVARPGVDGILIGYRAGHPGIWAYYPISGEFKFMSPTFSAFVEGWFGGSLSV